MAWKALAVLGLVAEAAAQNMLRFGCSQLVVERVDPIVEPGSHPSAHTHQVVGGNSFNATVRNPQNCADGPMPCILLTGLDFQMDPSSMDPSKVSTCTSCTYSEDFSNYWTASMYFKSPENGSYKRVPQFANYNGFSGARLPQDGGLTVYYMPPFSGNTKTTAFKPVSRILYLLFFVGLLAPPTSGVACTSRYSTSPVADANAILPFPGLPNARRRSVAPHKEGHISRHLSPLPGQWRGLRAVRLQGYVRTT